MTLHALGGPGAAGTPGTSYSGTVYRRNTQNEGMIVIGSDLWFRVDPVGGNAAFLYGWTAGVSPRPDLLVVSWQLRIDDFFDDAVALAEVGSHFFSDTPTRQVSMSALERLAISDKDDDEVGSTDAAYLVAGDLDTKLWMLWLYDQRSLTNTRDMLWVYKSGAWDLAIDVSGHGDGVANSIESVTFGTPTGKGPLPTAGGRYYVRQMGVQNLSRGPNMLPLGSLTVKVKMPNGDGTYSDFDTGVGASPHPDPLNVDEIPTDEDTTYDEGDVAGDLQSYAMADADGGDDVLAVHVVGATKQDGVAADMTPRGFIYDGTTRDNDPTYTVISTNYGQVSDEYVDITHNQINGVDLSETLFNSLEAGVEITAIQNSKKLRLSQIGLEYPIEGSKALPSDFPDLRIAPTGVALGSSNMGII